MHLPLCSHPCMCVHLPSRVSCPSESRSCEASCRRKNEHAKSQGRKRPPPTPRRHDAVDWGTACHATTRAQGQASRAGPRATGKGGRRRRDGACCDRFASRIRNGDLFIGPLGGLHGEHACPHCNAPLFLNETRTKCCVGCSGSGATAEAEWYGPFCSSPYIPQPKTILGHVVDVPWACWGGEYVNSTIHAWHGRSL